MKFVEQQLVAALVETPQETECSLSAALLKSIGLADVAVQAVWLSNHRPAKEGKSWQAIGDHWEYTADPVPDVPIVPIALRSGTSWRTSPANAERLLTPIVVKPVSPLASRTN